MAGTRGWNELLQQSSQLVAEGPGVDTQFPPIERNLDQLAVLSSQLKARTSRLDAGTEATAATRLLAREGIDADRLARDLRSFELKTTFEDVFPVEAASVDEYLQQVHEMTVLSAIQEAQKESLRSFDTYMLQSSEAIWAAEKSRFLQSLAGAPLAPPSASQNRLGRGGPPNRSPALGGAYTGGGAMTPAAAAGGVLSRGQVAPSGAMSLTEKKAEAYAEVLKNLNAARESNQAYKVATSFREAYEATVGIETTRSVNMRRIWQLVQSLLGEDPWATRAIAGASRRMAMAAGARRHLESGHEKYMLDVIQSHPAQAAMGGSTGNLARVRAFLRVRLREQGMLDFDSGDNPRQPPLDTTWNQIYFCLRSGFYEEAKQVAQQSASARRFAGALSEWVDKGGVVLPATAAQLADECERMARQGDRQGKATYDRKRMLLHAVVSGSKSAAERLLRDIPVLFSTIEDFMWFKLALLRDTAGPENVAAYTLEELQSYLKQYPPSYYTKDGREPLVYPYILLLSLQLHAAIQHLFKDPAAETYRVDAVHMAASLGEKGALSEEMSGGGADAAAEVASILKQYGTSYLRRGQPEAAVEYYAIAASVIGGGQQGSSRVVSDESKRRSSRLQEQALREMLRHPAGMDLLLGSSFAGAADGVLCRFFHQEEERRRVILAAAGEALDAGQYQEAAELFKRGGAFASALQLVNQQMAEALAAVVANRPDSESRVAAIQQRGTDILGAAEACLLTVTSQERDLFGDQQRAYSELGHLLAFFRLHKGGKYGVALKELAQLPYLPFENRSPDHCKEALACVAPAVKSRLQDAVRLLPECFDRLPDTDGSLRALRVKIVEFVAAAGEQNWPQDVYESVGGMYASTSYRR